MRTRLTLISLLALSLSACGGRVIGDGAFDDPDAGDGGSSTDGGGDAPGTETPITDDSAISLDDTSPPTDDGFVGDTSVPPFDTSVPPFDTGVIGSDSSIVFDGGGGSDSSITFDTAADSTTTDTLTDTTVADSGTDTGALDTGTDTAMDVPADGPPITAVCDQIATSTCTPSYQMCCTAHGFTWDELGCADVAKLICNNSVNGVSTGKTVYNAGFADACAAAWKSATSACALSLVDWIKNRVPCAHLFNGKTPPGGACAEDTDCHAEAGAIGICDKSSNRCRQYAIVSKGGACNYFGINPRICDSGLYCNFTTGSFPVCDTATPLGGSCFGIDDTSCGLGHSCKSATCQPGSPAGASCSQDLECASWSCRFGKCTDPNVLLASKALCGGA